jgi:hypothetical protein
MKAVKTSASQAGAPALAADSQVLELRERDHAMLPGCEGREIRVLVGVAEFCIHVHA